MRTNFKYWSCVLKYNQISSEGKANKVSQGILVESQSYSESEARITEFVQKHVKEDFSISSLHPTKITECIPYNEEGLFPWWECCVHFSFFDEDKKKETTRDLIVLVQNDLIDNVLKILSNRFENGKIISISLSNIVYLYPYISNTNSPNIQTENKILSTYGEDAYKCYQKICSLETEKELTKVGMYEARLKEHIKREQKDPISCGKELRNKFKKNIGSDSDFFLGVAIRMEIEKEGK